MKRFAWFDFDTLNMASRDTYSSEADAMDDPASGLDAVIMVSFTISGLQSEDDQTEEDDPWRDGGAIPND